MAKTNLGSLTERYLQAVQPQGKKLIQNMFKKKLASSKKSEKPLQGAHQPKPALNHRVEPSLSSSQLQQQMQLQKTKLQQARASQLRGVAQSQLYSNASSQRLRPPPESQASQQLLQRSECSQLQALASSKEERKSSPESKESQISNYSKKIIQAAFTN